MSDLKVTPIRQNHSINIVFEGTMFGLIELLRSKDLNIDFIPPGLMNSGSVMIIEEDKKENNG